MKRSRYVLLGLFLWCQASSLVYAAAPPAKVVEQFIETHLQGQFAASRSLTLERVNLSASLFSNWFFGTAGTGGTVPTADLFLSRKFTQVFRYTITGTAATGDNQVAVAAVRASPNLAHLYTWALAPKRGGAPYELVDAVDTYLTKVNFPVEESRMQFILVREVDSWYISTVYDEKFAQLQQQLQGQSGLQAGTGAAAPATSAGPAGATSTSTDIGRQLADAQFNATLQGFNRGYQPSGPAAAAKKEDELGFFGKLSQTIFGGGKSESTEKSAVPAMTSTFKNIRDALARYAVAHNSVPDIASIYDWKSLRKVVNQYGKTELPATEAEARFTFVNYIPERSREGYTLVVDLLEPQDGVKRVEITPYGVDRVN